ncbi:hypothetical protein [Polymorphospora rubra]|uniref:hypothetical protein n=1 Tax=Polymorphospora rubra TaxID=338584 RepID=UPI0033E7DA62
MTLTVIDRSRVPELARLAGDSTAAVRAAIVEHGHRPPSEYGWSGYCMSDLLEYLEDRGVELDGSEFAAESAAINEVYDLAVLITSAHRRFLDQLDPGGHSADELTAHFEEMGNGFAESATAGFDALKLLYDNISRLQDDEVLLLHIG